MGDEPGTGKGDARREGHSAEQAIIEARRAKGRRARDRGENPFANDVTRLGPPEDIGDVRRRVEAACEGGKYAAAQVERLSGGRPAHVCGRVVALRSTGALSFARVRDRTGEIQLMLDEAVLQADYGRLDDVDVGDFVQARGALTASTGLIPWSRRLTRACRTPVTILVPPGAPITIERRPCSKTMQGVIMVTLVFPGASELGRWGRGSKPLR